MVRIGWCLCLCAGLCSAPAQALQGTVYDAVTGKPIADATVLVDAVPLRSDVTGRFRWDGAPAHTIAARAVGYAPTAWRSAGDEVSLRLVPVRPKALYLSAHGVGSAVLREAALALADRTEVNALVIDLKDDRGLTPHRSEALRREGLVQSSVMVPDMAHLVPTLHGRGLYLIARIVVFKDDALAAQRPAWSVHDVHGNVWHDAQQQRWIDPFQRDAWQHSLAVAEEAATFGFDEVQFDYLRFPDAPGLRFDGVNDEASRVATIGAFLAQARQRLSRFNVFVAADIFGYVAWNQNDTSIGQQLEALAGQVDYLCPMLYPSGFTFGIPGHRTPVATPRDIVDHTLRRAFERTGLPAVRWRPWLQAFRDYAFDHRPFGAAELRAQIDAAEALGTDGWMLWNPHNRYDAEGLLVTQGTP